MVNVSAVLKSLYLLAIFVILQSINSEGGHPFDHLFYIVFILFNF